MEGQKHKFEKTFGNVTKKKQIHESVLLVENSNGDVSYSFEYGGKKCRYTVLYREYYKAVDNYLYFYFERSGKTVTR